MIQNSRIFAAVLVIGFLAAPVSVADGKNGKKGGASRAAGRIETVLWRDPGGIGARDLFYGPGGEARQPRPPFTFVKEDTGGTNPKYVVTDGAGVKWTVKLGSEARPETAASRLIWAAGFGVSENYFLPIIRIKDIPRRLKRGRELIGPDGSIENVRLKRSDPSLEKIGAWHWADNPFLGTRELNGLRVLMALINNWDIKDGNNAIYQLKHPPPGAAPEQIYIVSDLGSSFGGTGYSFIGNRAKGNLRVYAASKFITRITPEYLDFATPSHPSLLSPVNIPDFFFMWLRLRWIGKQVPRADARWIGGILGRLSHAQISDAFRAAGYQPGQTEAFTAIVERRIAALRDL